MARPTVGDMLERAREFERRLEHYYADLRDRTTQDGTRLLTFYLARDRLHLPEALESFNRAQLERFKREPLESEPPAFNPARCFAGKKLPNSAGGDELLATAIEFVEMLINFYRAVLDRVHDEDARELIRDLLRIEESHVIELKKTKAMHYF